MMIQTQGRSSFRRVLNRRFRTLLHRIKSSEKIPFPPEPYLRLVGGDVSDVLGKYIWAGHRMIDMLEEEGLISAGSRFLDVGCGCGRVARYLLDKPLKSYTGFDRHAGMIDWCRKEIAPLDPRFDFRCCSVKSAYTDLDGEEGEMDADAFTFPFEEAAFDSALLASIFTHMPMTESVHYLGELRRVVRPDGRVLLSVFYSQDKPYSKGNIDFFYDSRAFLAAVKRSGFEYKFQEELNGQHLYVLTRK